MRQEKETIELERNSLEAERVQVGSLRTQLERQQLNLDSEHRLVQNQLHGTSTFTFSAEILNRDVTLMSPTELQDFRNALKQAMERIQLEWKKIEHEKRNIDEMHRILNQELQSEIELLESAQQEISRIETSTADT